MTDIQTIEITLFGETHEVECWVRPDATGDVNWITSVGAVVVGRFPTGTKLHRSPLRLWKRERGVHGITGKPLAPLRGATAAVVDGVEFVADFTLYTHNRNTGRIVAWDTEAFAPAVARWNGAY